MFEMSEILILKPCLHSSFLKSFFLYIDLIKHSNTMWKICFMFPLSAYKSQFSPAFCSMRQSAVSMLLTN